MAAALSFLVPLNQLPPTRSARTVTAFEAERVWSRKAQTQAESEHAFRYSSNSLEELDKTFCSSAACHTWCVYIHGYSLFELSRMRNPLDPRKMVFDNWDEINESFESNRMEGWALTKPEAGFYVLNTGRNLMNLSWVQQDAGIRKSRPNCLRAHEALVAEAVLTIAACRDTKVLANWTHIGNKYANVRNSSQQWSVGIRQSTDRPELSLTYEHIQVVGFFNSGVCLLRKHDF